MDSNLVTFSSDTYNMDMDIRNFIAETVNNFTLQLLN